MNPEKPQFDEILVVYNPEGSQARKVGVSVIDLLRAEDSPWSNRLQIINTEDPRQTNNVDLIAGHIQPNQLIIPCGGDGSSNDVGNAMRKMSVDVLETAHILPLAFGNANDTAISLNGQAIKKPQTLIELLTSGVTRELDIIQVDIDGLERIALSYVGLGYTALGSQALNAEKHRAMKKANPFKPANKPLDGLQLFRAMINRYEFDFTESDNSGTVQELVFATLPRMAAGLIKFNTKGMQGEMVCVEMTPEFFMAKVIKQLISGQLWGIKGKRIANRQLKIDTPTVIHYDGEPQVVGDGTLLSINVIPRAINSLVLPKAA